jgi:hypothetical protein
VFHRIVLPLVLTLAILPLVAASIGVGLLWCVHQWDSPIWLLTLIGGVAFVGVSYAVWRAARKLTEDGFKFSLRGMLIGVAVMALLLSTVGRWMLGTYHQQRAVQAVWSHGGRLEDGTASDERGRLHRWMGHNPFERVAGLSVISDAALAAAIDHSDQFADIAILRFRRGVSASGFEQAGKLNQFPKLGLGEFMESTIDDEGLAQLAKWTNVRHLFFNGCPNVTDAGLRHLARLPKLEVLELYEEGGGMVITDAGLAHVGRIEALRCLHIANMPKITDAGLAQLHRLSNLRKITIRRTGVSAEGLKQFYKALPDCHVVSDMFVPGAAEVQRIVVRKIGAPDQKINSISDPARIGAIRMLIEESEKGHDFYASDFRTNEPWPGATHRLEFMGKTRVLYEMRVGKGLVQKNVAKPANNYPGYWVKWRISDAQESQLNTLVQPRGED